MQLWMQWWRIVQQLRPPVPDQGPFYGWLPLSTALDLDKLTRLWVIVIQNVQPGILRINGRRMLLINSLGMTDPFYFVADAYYTAGKVIRGLVDKGNHLISRVKKNAVAYEQPQKSDGPKGRGRPCKYGTKISLRSMFGEPDTMQEAASPVYGEKAVTIRFRCLDLLWRPVGILVRFVASFTPPAA